MADLSASDLKRLLAERHAHDVWVPECKNGPTWGANVLRLDGWAMRKSWSPWTTIGYEIKVSRSDFEGDQKWPGYLPYCHEFYFVCPAGLIRGADLPPGIGLIWATVNGGRLVTKVKSIKREPEIDKLVQLMAYVLMSRTRIVGDMHEANARGDGGDSEADRLQQIRRLVEDAEARRELAGVVNAHVCSRFAAQKREIEQMREQVEFARELREHLVGLGVDWPTNRWLVASAKRQLDELAGVIDPTLRHQLAHARDQIDRMIGMVDRIQGREVATPAQEVANG